MKFRSNIPAKLFMVLAVLCMAEGNSSAQGKFSATAGWGYYELINAGVQWNYSEISSLSVYAGSNFGTSNRTSWAAGLSFDQTFRKPLFWKIKAGYSLGALYWTNDDESYYFQNISFPMMGLLAYQATPSLALRIEGGVLFNAILKSDRKQNVEAGYPERINGNVRLSFIYKLGRK